jgi:tetratricopeptide (TPR) repeat protein
MGTKFDANQQLSMRQIINRIESAENPDWEIFVLSLEKADKNNADLPEFMRVCAIPRKFDQRIICILRNIPDEEAHNTELLDQLCSYSFVVRREDGSHVYSDGVREAVLADWRSSDEKRAQFTAINDRLAQYYEDEYKKTQKLEKDLRIVSSIMRNTNLARYRKLDSLINERLTSPLLEALYQRLLASPEGGFSFFLDNFFKQETAGHFLTCQALISSTQDFLLRLPLDQKNPNQLAWLEYFDIRILYQLPPCNYSHLEERLNSLSKREDLEVKLRFWVLDQLAIVQEKQQKRPAALMVRKGLLALVEESGEDIWNLPLWAKSLGKSYWELGELDHAIEHYRRAIQIADAKEDTRPDLRVLGRCDLSGIYCEAGQWDKGIKNGVEALYLARTEFSENPEIQTEVAFRLMQLLVNFDQAAAETAAQECFSLIQGTEQDALAAHDNYIAVLDSAGRTGFAEFELKKLRAETEQSEHPSLFQPALLFREAFIYDRLGRHEEAIATYSELIVLCESGLVTNWDKAAALSNRGRMFIIEGNWKSAEADLSAALGLWEQYGHETMIAFVHLLLADLMRWRGLLSDAQKYLDRAAKVLKSGIRRFRDEFHQVQGEVYFAQGQWEKAQKHFEMAYQICSSRRDRKYAVKMLQKLCETTVENADWRSAAELTARLAQECKDLATLDAYQPSSVDNEANKENAEAIRLLSESVDIHGGCQLFKSAQENAPTNFWYQMNLAFANAKRGYWADAAQALEGAINNAPEEMRVPRLYRCWPDFLVNHAASCYQQGKISKAISGIENAVHSLDSFIPADDLVALRVRFGDYQLADGRFEEAKQTYGVAIEHAKNMHLQREQLQLTVRQAILKSGSGMLSEAVSKLKSQLVHMEPEEYQRLTEIFNEIVDLIQTPFQFHAVTDLLRALRTTEGMHEQVVEIADDQLLALVDHHYCHLTYPLSRLKPPREFVLLPLVTPIALELDVHLAPSDDAPGVRWMLDKGFPNMREKILREMGVRIPSIRVRTNESIAPGSYFHSLFDCPIYLYTVYEGKRFCPDAQKCLEIGLSGLKAENYGPSGGTGLWLDESQWAKAKAAKLPLLDLYEYMTIHTESVVRSHLSAFLGIQELYDLLNAWVGRDAPFEALPPDKKDLHRKLSEKVVQDDHVFHRLLRVLRALLRESVPILRLEEILTEVLAAGEQVGGDNEVIERIRMVLRDDLPGNRNKRTHIGFPERLESLMLRGVHQQDGKVFYALPPNQVQDFLTEIRNLLPQSSQSDLALVVSKSEVRPVVGAMLSLEFPQIPVLARREVLIVE